MKTLFLFDSYFGNTEKIARAMGGALTGAVVKNVKEISPQDLEGVELFITGSPTRGFNPTKQITAFLKSLTAESLKGKKIAAFDTRLSLEQTNSRIFSFMAKIFGYAAESMEKLLRKKGGEPAIPAEGFIVVASEGPLKAGEEERAVQWVQKASGK